MWINWDTPTGIISMNLHSEQIAIGVRRIYTRWVDGDVVTTRGHASFVDACMYVGAVLGLPPVEADRLAEFLGAT